MRSAVLLAFLGGCGAVSIHVATPATGDGAGAPAAPFALASQTGETVSLPTAPTLLVFYRGFW